MKKILVALVVLLLLVGGVVYAINPPDKSQSTYILIAGTNVLVTPQRALQTETLRTDSFLLPGNNTVFPGQLLAEIEVIVRNIAPFEQWAIFYAIPTKVESHLHPSLTALARGLASDYRGWEPFLMAPNSEKRLIIQVSLAHNSFLEEFRGIYLVVEPLAPPPKIN